MNTVIKSRKPVLTRKKSTRPSKTLRNVKVLSVVFDGVNTASETNEALNLIAQMILLDEEDQQKKLTPVQL